VEEVAFSSQGFVVLRLLSHPQDQGCKFNFQDRREQVQGQGHQRASSPVKDYEVKSRSSEDEADEGKSKAPRARPTRASQGHQGQGRRGQDRTRATRSTRSRLQERQTKSRRSRARSARARPARARRQDQGSKGRKLWCSSTGAKVRAVLMLACLRIIVRGSQLLRECAVRLLCWISCVICLAGCLIVAVV